jgi:hypothetical protein
MAEAHTGVFYYRHNADGSWDLFCPKCLKHIATAEDGITLSSAEHRHACLGTSHCLWRDVLLGKPVHLDSF